MLMLMMISGLVARAWGAVRPTARPATRFHPRPASDEIEMMWSEKKHADRLRSSAAWHAKDARKAVVDLDGKGVLEHMRHFRRYSSGLTNPHSYQPGTCGACGATAEGRRMVSHMTKYGRRPVCIPCSGYRDRPMWITGWSAFPVEEMDDGYLVNVVLRVHRQLCAGRRVDDDRIRMCGHVLEECHQRGIIGKITDRIY